MSNNNKEQSYYEYAVRFVNNHKIFISFSASAIVTAYIYE